MERVDRGQPFLVIVDYAHTPAALATALDALAPLAGPGGGLIAVFGSAGERDVGKRALQGRVAGERCRLVVATDEDPRREDPAAILEQIAEGAEAAGKRRGDDLLLVADRAAAIREAFARARPGDVVLLAGKGHERGILYADRELRGTSGPSPRSFALRGTGPTGDSAAVPAFPPSWRRRSPVPVAFRQFGLSRRCRATRSRHAERPGGHELPAGAAYRPRRHGHLTGEQVSRRRHGRGSWP
jgi:hypothetical protein